VKSNEMAQLVKVKKCDGETRCFAFEKHAPIMNMGVRAKGLTRESFLDITTGKICTFAAYRETPQSRPLLINFCPWCGANFKKRHDKLLKPKAAKK